MTDQAPDLDLRRRLAERLGYTQIRSYGTWEIQGMKPDRSTWCYTIPRWELSMDACMELVAAANKEGGLWTIYQTYAGTYRVSFIREDKTFWGDAATPAKATCEAWLALP
ncbi:MAG: hypothetical protein Q8P59_05280 [Dehalococcoidia bacterium]|nr:hypothetical protein [Dehalococcoidia bacterium]